MRRLMIVLGLLLAVPFAVRAQDSKFELFGGYNFTHVTDSSSATFNFNGGGGDVGFFPVKWIGVVGTVDYSHSGGYTFDGSYFTAPTNSLAYGGGPRVRFSVGRITPYVQVIFGAVHRSNLETSTGLEISGPETSFGYSVGGGIDFKLVPHISVRLVQASYLHTGFTSPNFGSSAVQNDFNIQTGIVIH
jgi:opacity protein-like surface antigen